jgi:membrane fusion protein, adhesin transport system
VFEKRTTSKLTPRLNQPLSLETGKPPRVVSGTLYSLSFLAVASIAWASLSEIREMTSAPGQIMPIGQVNNIQHLEGGIVSEIYVKEGAFVKEGEPLIRLSPNQAAAEADQMKSRSASLQLTLERIDAVWSVRKPNFTPFKASFPQLVSQQQALYDTDMMAKVKETETLNTRIRQKQNDVETYGKEEASLAVQLKIQREQMAIQNELMSKGYTSKKAHLEARAATQKAESDYANVVGKTQSAREALKESQNLLAEYLATNQRKMADERSKAASDYAEMAGQVDKQADRMDRLVVRAPATGIIQEFMPKVNGEVVKPSDIIGKIVPEGQEMIAEVRIDPKEIGHIKVGDRSEVKFATYDPALFGYIIGTVQSISPTTILPSASSNPIPGQDGGMGPQSYYKAIVKLNSMRIGEGKLSRPVSPGMVVTADIITGSKSLTRYMLKPVARSLDKAFTER